MLSVEWYSEPSRTSELELFTKIVNGLKSKTLRLGMQDLTIDILCCKIHLYIDLKKMKYFAPEKEDIVLMRLFLSYCLERFSSG